MSRRNISIEIPSSEAQRQNLAEWLSLWKIDEELRRGDDSDEQSQMKGVVLRTALDAGSVLEIDEIRLLYSDSQATWRRPVYLAVLEKAMDDLFLVAPFSRFEYPALPGEFITGFEAPQLRVLSIWNAFHIRRMRLEGGWQVDRLDRDDRELALAVHAALRGERDFPLDLVDRTAPPLKHPLDPRWEYREEELEMVEALMPLADLDSPQTHYESRESPVEYRDKAADAPRTESDGEGD